MRAAESEQSTAMVSVRGIQKRFNISSDNRNDTLVALDNISFDVPAGQFVSLLGASGCGKTTLLRIIAGLIRAESGEVLVQGEAVSAPRRDVCMVFQNFGLLPWRTVVDNVVFPLELDGRPRNEREALAQRYIALVGLSGFERRFPHELSGGMQQRVGIARALTRQPIVLLMDEPFAALDAQTRESLQEEFLKISAKLKTTVIFVTHSIDEALVMSDRIFILSGRPGRLTRIVDSPVDDRINNDVRAHPRYATYRHEIREMLRGPAQ